MKSVQAEKNFQVRSEFRGMYPRPPKISLSRRTVVDTQSSMCCWDVVGIFLLLLQFTLNAKLKTLELENKSISVPPKYINTRWTIWRDCTAWWIDHIDLFRRFMNNDTGLLKKNGGSASVIFFKKFFHRKSFNNHENLIFKPKKFFKKITSDMHGARGARAVWKHPH